jgi:hypothetical protein
MLKGTVSKTLLFMAALFCAFSSSAQDEAYNAYSPYSMFGIGDISKQGTAYNKSMGGVGIATRDKRHINILNPAAVTAREEKSFMADFGVAQGNRYYAQKDIKSSNNTFNIYDFVISFPVYKSIAMYAGVTPYSDLGYDMTSKVTDPSIISKTGVINNTVQGYGGMTNLFLGAGVNVVKGLSVGVEGQYYFGNLTKTNDFTMSNSSYRNISSGFNMELRAFTAKFGAQYETKVSQNVSAVIGATYRLGTSLGGKVERYEIQTISSINDSTPSPRSYVDTLGKGRVKLAGELGVGIAVKGGDKWTAEINYIRSDWTSSNIDKVPGFANVGNAVFSASSSQSVRAGFSIVPNRNDIRYYRKRVTYRAGAYWDQAYCKLDGKSIDAVGLTLGATLPVFSWSNGLTLGVDFGQRGSLTGNQVRERYVNFNIGINIFDIWFLKPKYN